MCPDNQSLTAKDQEEIWSNEKGAGGPFLSEAMESLTLAAEYKYELGSLGFYRFSSWYLVRCEHMFVLGLCVC